MSDLPHLRLEGTEKANPYTYAGPTPQGEFALPPRDRPVHAQKVKKELQNAEAEAIQRRQARVSRQPDLFERQPEGIVLTFRSDPDKELKLSGLERRGRGIELLGVTEENGTMVARVFVPEGEMIQFIKLVEDYAIQKGKDRSKKLIESIASVRLAVVEDFWQDTLPFPGVEEGIWWEVWLRGERAEADEVHADFAALAATVGISQVSTRHVSFPERVVLHAFATARQLSESIDLLAMIAELRKAKELATSYLDLPARDQKDFVQDVTTRLELPGPDAPCVSVIDRGVNRPHPLLSPALSPADMHASDPAWGTADDHPRQHGTGMAGNALYGCLTEVMTTTGPIVLRHRLESVKIMPPPPQYNEPPVYGSVMQQGVANAYISAAKRKRVLCMAMTADDRDMGMPTMWSAAGDDMCAGVLDEIQKLMLISAGNIRDELFTPEYRYHEWNTTKAGVEDPGQAWNALTIGAMTDKVFIQDPTYAGYEPIAGAGDLCPTSRTSLPWPDDNQRGWPIKPDLVAEGGNFGEKAGGRSEVEDLSLLTTRLYPTGKLFDTNLETSAATALVSRTAAVLWSHYPRLWPETVRALLVHTAKWTDAMRARFPGDNKTTVQRLLRCYGYGVPDLKRAVNSAENNVTLIFEGELQPFRKDGSDYKSNQMHLHELPWPIEILEGLGEEKVTMRVTLSYFIEPSPNRVGWGSNHRYQSHGLRFDVIRPLEGLDAFKQRISRTEWTDPKKRPSNVADTRNWVVGEQGRTHGSLHSDWWEGKAVELARCGRIAVYPVTGWWKERAHLGRFDRRARYSLIVTIESPNVEVDLYNVIKAAPTVQTEVMV